VALARSLTSADNRVSRHAYLGSVELESRILKATKTRGISGRDGKQDLSNAVSWLGTWELWLPEVVHDALTAHV